ncbi:GDSL-type esterase/lipase family protein [Eubacterium oxidoreducens]|uniref:Lysophospholipase L1 n=1 Tax=Eubacterium oxidoreducens TaxID=1732 RepID=A0A1G6BHD1_EUBOX|nr:GDSL-type esterase/lipase family protein [Eubacterium oxidoreducens]SDB20006.1 Lysophospholipase L1 [Eubacterium oxidoreducens]
MKNILCYGDSNTYGYNPLNGMRFSKKTRWTALLQSNLQDFCDLIEEGCNGRTTVFSDPKEPWKNGYDYLRPCLNSHKPLDMVIFMLGTNDLKKQFNATAIDVARGMEKLVEETISFTKEKQGYVPKIILMAPPIIGTGIKTSAFNYSFDESAIERSKELPALYEQIAEQYGCIFVNAAAYVRSSRQDSVHMMPSEHEILANKLSRLIRLIDF